MLNDKGTGGHVTLIPLSSAGQRAAFARIAIQAPSEQIEQIHFSSDGRLVLRILSSEERSRIGTLGPALATVWSAATTTARDRKELIGTLIEEVIVKVERDKSAAHLTLRWKGGALTEIDLALPRKRQATVRTDEDTVALVRRLAAHYPDTVIAGILNRQGRRTARGHRFEGNRVCSLRRHWNIPCFEPKPTSDDGELLTIKKAAAALGVAPSTIHRLINDGIIAGEQITPGAPWRIPGYREFMLARLVTPVCNDRGRHRSFRRARKTVAFAPQLRLNPAVG
jgi:hypothetical protein